MREGTRREKATSGCGDMEIEANEDKVAPWNGCVAESVEEFDEEGMYDVITATGCAVSRSNIRTRLCRSVPMLCGEVEFHRLCGRLGLRHRDLASMIRMK